MAGRRRDARFEVPIVDGVLRVLRDVTVRRGKGAELVAIDADAALPGEIVTIHLVVDGDIRARVVESRPVLIHGSVRHRLRLVRLDANAPGRAKSRRHGDRE